MAFYIIPPNGKISLDKLQHFTKCRLKLLLNLKGNTVNNYELGMGDLQGGYLELMPESLSCLES